VHPDDRSMWRQAGRLRRDMLDEQVLHHAVVRKAMIERLLGPPEVADLGPEPGAELEPEPPPLPEPSGGDADPASEEMSDEEFARRMTAGFNAIINGLPEEKRAVLARLSQEQLWRLVGDLAFSENRGDAQPQGP
jgi:hypothetical protein